VEIVCQRCHQTVPESSCFCPSCGLPQLVYESEESNGAGTQKLEDSVRDASSVDWKPLLRIAAALAVPAGMFSNFLGLFGAIFMALVSAFVVFLYMRNRHPAWLTIGAGARIGLVTGVLGSWAAVATAGISLFVMRFGLGQGKTFDDLWATLAGQQVPAQLAAAGWDAQMIAAQRAQMVSPDGQAGWTIGILVFLSAMLLLFAVAGGAVGARLVLRARRTEF
jgi:hypothetical protein